MNILELLNSDQGKQIIDGIGKQTGTTQQEASSVISAAAPVIMGMLQKNASTQDGAAGILGALNKHDGSIFDNLSGFLGATDNTTDGNNILGHILGGNQNTVVNSLSGQTGVSATKVAGILAMLAPILMGFLGKQTKSSGGINAGGLGNVLGSILGNSTNGNVAGSILGSILGGGNKKAGGALGDILGGFLGKK